ncbi:MAG: DNA replication terminus site-binding protein [Sodalis sp. (in: enterobacteria)]
MCEEINRVVKFPLDTSLKIKRPVKSAAHCANVVQNVKQAQHACPFLLIVFWHTQSRVRALALRPMLNYARCTIHPKYAPAAGSAYF